MTFWGVEFFKSTQNKEVLYGTTLYWPLFRQISAEDQETLDNMEDIMRWVALATLFLILPVITAGSMLPTWMFINSLQIIAHLALVKTMIPANAHYFLKQYLDWLRWYDSDFWTHMQERYDFKRYQMDFGAYHYMLKACDYDHLFAQNMVIVIIVFLTALTVMLICSVRDLLCRLR